MHIIDKAFEKAIEVVRMNVTDQGFTACSMAHDSDPTSNYRSIWARDAAMTTIWSLPLKDKELTECGRRSLETILNAQTDVGHIPNYVEVERSRPEFGGIGNIAGIDGAMWVIIAVAQYVHATGDKDTAKRLLPKIKRTMTWLRCHDSNNCGLLEVPESSDWTDLFPRSYNVLYDELLWHRVNLCYAEMLKIVREDPQTYYERAAVIKELINRQFWPTPENIGGNVSSFAETQYALGRTRYLIAQITPFGFSWRCDVFANILACLFDVLDHERQLKLYPFLRQISIDHPHPVKILYPVIHPGEPDWRDYFLVNLQNLPHHYHNGGIWPFVGGLWVRFLCRLGKRSHAEEAMERLAFLCQDGMEYEWEFNEWAHGQTGRPMGKAYQAWSAASYIAAYLELQGDKELEWPVFHEDESSHEHVQREVNQAKDLGTSPEIFR